MYIDVTDFIPKMLPNAFIQVVTFSEMCLIESRYNNKKRPTNTDA